MYENRFIDAMNKYFFMVPDRWALHAHMREAEPTRDGKKGVVSFQSSIG